MSYRNYCFLFEIVTNFIHNKIPDIREVYRPKGFYEFEPLIPTNNDEESLREILELCIKHKSQSLLCGVKYHKADNYLLSFEGKGFSIGIDIQVSGRKKENIKKFVEELSALTISLGGKIYLAKDENLSKEDFKAMYPSHSEFLKTKENLDPTNLFSSEMFNRLMK